MKLTSCCEQSHSRRCALSRFLQLQCLEPAARQFRTKGTKCQKVPLIAVSKSAQKTICVADAQHICLLFLRPPTIHEGLSALLEDYKKLLEDSPSSIRLPFILHYEPAADMPSEENGLLECPRQLFSLELTFSSSEHYLPIEPIRIPFIAAGQIDRPDQDEDEGNGHGFPCLNKLLLRLRPRSPVPTSFGARISKGIQKVATAMRQRRTCTREPAVTLWRFRAVPAAP
eukprot:Skav217238  [mRNA]  locus=scaffold110:143896:152286:+ [translate_table: standard]